MKLVYGDVWGVASSFNAICILTNGIVKDNGELVMGAGLALEAKQKFPQLPRVIGSFVKQYGNRVFNLGRDEGTGIRFVSFPTKHNYKDNSDLKLIEQSCIQLVELATKNKWDYVLLPRPGVGKGNLNWKDVEKVLDKYLDDRFYVISNNPMDMEPVQEKSIPQQQKKILECSSKGDIRFSAFGAKVNMFGVFNTIENHYQFAKRFGTDNIPTSFKDCKGKKPTHIIINGIKLGVEYLTPWYKLLWLTYLDNNSELVAYARTFDDYNDIFKGNSVNCQADVIRQYIKQGRDSLINDCSALTDILYPSASNDDEFPSLDDNTDTVSSIPVAVTSITPNTSKQYKTVCVTGHRPKDLWGYHSSAKYQQLQNKIYYCLKQFHDQYNVKEFISGGAQGVDQLFFWVSHHICSREFSDCINHLFIPFNGQENAWVDEGKFGKSEYNQMVNSATKVTVVNPNINSSSTKDLIVKALYDRNTAMVNNSDFVLGVYKGDINDISSTTPMNGGTLHALRTAYSQGKPIVVINPFTLVATRINF